MKEQREIAARATMSTPSTPRVESLKLHVNSYVGREDEPLLRWLVEVDTAITARLSSTRCRSTNINRWLCWKYRIRSQTETLSRSEYETLGISPPPADTAPAVSPTTAPPLASSAAETAGSNSPRSSGHPGGQASTSLTPPSASRAGAELASSRSPAPVTAESPTQPEDSAVGSTSPPLSSAFSAPSQLTSVGLGLLSCAYDSLSSPPEVSWCRKDVGAAWSC
ncbi:unnamed protein product [Phytophthora fragariaefolia]|uniref:Unnamed protein product n=1 Tax=Phytophthora fragariaefolia TaxID=1490495 RepID=A0A9W6XRP2_9STRA|nr:unnamed protein product [Phytophthora fragariaefolia]